MSLQINQHLGKADTWLLAATYILLGFSVLMVFSTTAVISQEVYGSSTSMIKRHLLHVFVGLGVFFLFTRLSVNTLYRLAVPFLIGGVFLLILVLIPQIGHAAGGAQRWIALGPLRVQPGELCKIVLIVYFSSYVERHKSNMLSFVPGVLIPFGIFSLFGALLLLEPDFGSTVVLLLVMLGQLFTVSRITHLLAVGAAAAVGFSVLVLNSPYRVKRLVAFLEPFNDPSSSGYQLIQSLIAVGSGGMFGSGLGAGKQKLFYLPAAHTDFIFAVIAEELGLFGALSILVLFLIILFRGLIICRRLAENHFLCSLAVGCTLLMVIPALLNMAVVSGLLPTKGLVLPLVAYGGTAMVVHLAAMGILLRLSRMEA